MKVLCSDEPAFAGGLSIFLAGPTPRTKEAKSWRPEAVEILRQLGFDGTVLLPERKDWSVKFDYTDQTGWELAGLTGSTVIVFWVPRYMATMPALTTNVEFGFWLARAPDKVIYGRPDSATNVRYLDWLYTKQTNGGKYYSHLEDTLRAAVEFTRRKFLASIPAASIVSAAPDFLTADLHLGEDRMKIKSRPFSSAQENVDYLLEQYNAVVKPEHTVWWVGDAVYQNAPGFLPQIARFNGTKILFRGNQDVPYSDEQLKQHFVEIVPEGAGKCIEVEGIRCWVQHYPTEGRTDMFNLVGHIHGAWKVQLNMLNVGVDVHHFRPMATSDIPFYVTAITKFYDRDIWVAYEDVNARFKNDRGAKTRYFKKDEHKIA